jgi:DNA replication protein DnaD
MDIIGEACKRTVLATCKPSIRYANGILKQWHDAKVKKPEDIIALDEEFRKKNVDAGGALASSKKAESKKTTAGKFHNFSERKIDYDSLRKDVLSN